MRPSPDELDAAVAAGVLERVQAERLRVFIDGRRREIAGPGRDREDVRFVRGFHDVFMSVGLIVLLFGARYAIEAGSGPTTLPLGYLAGAGLVWALAQLFTGRQRLVLPSIVLAAGFVCFAALAAMHAVRPVGGGPEALHKLLVAAAALAAALAFRLRFRLPFATLLVAAGVIGSVIAVLAAVWPSLVTDHWKPLLLAAGLASFAGAMRFDLRDPERETLSADNAFWLHLLAAPLIVHSLVSIAIENPGSPNGWQAAVVIAIVAALAFVALAVDRRALLMSGLIYFGVALGVLISKTAIDAQAIFAVTLVLLGGLVVALGAGWTPARRLALRALPPRLRAALPPAR